MNKHLQHYIQDLLEIKQSGMAVKETSYYPPLEKLLNGIGIELNPKVRCIIHLKNKGAGIPDGGFFTKDQLKNVDATTINVDGTLPARGVLEVKSTKEDVSKIAQEPQVAKYLDRYGQVLVTNYRSFLLVERDKQQHIHLLERYDLAEDEKTFWQKASQPTDLATEHGDRLEGYLLRVLLRNAPLRDPKDVAWFMASYAREAKARIEKAPLPELNAIRQALEDALGIRFEGDKGDHFFKSTLIQTLFYGMFSAWVLYHAEGQTEPFNWKLSGWPLKVPMINGLFSRIAQPKQLKQLDLIEVLDWAADMLNRVNPDEFFTRFEQEDAVQYFYEPFLQAFDPELRKDLGVWYTPREVVQYMVQRVDTALRTELNIPKGLADSRVVVLDPCCGTGAFLVEAAKLIADRLAEDGDAFAGEDLRDALMQRIFGFEIMPAPFVVAHLQLGLLLQRRNAALKDGQRAGVYLTNALTGWEPMQNPKQLLAFPELQEERDAAGLVKQQQRILVVLGNPPYNGFGGVATKEENGIINLYKQGLREIWGIKKYNLDELYARFFRLAERRIAEFTGEGIVCYVSSFSYLRDPSFVVMRQRLLSEFDSIWIDSLNGDSRETGKKTPDGQPDPSIFSTPQNKEGIQKGTAIGLFVRKPTHLPSQSVQFRQFWGKHKRDELLASISGVTATVSAYDTVAVTPESRFSFYPTSIQSNYIEWPKLTELCAVDPINGLMEKRKGALFNIDRGTLSQRMQDYFDRTISWEVLSHSGHGLTKVAARFEAKETRERLLKTVRFSENAIKSYTTRPFDQQWCYYTTTRPIWNEPRPRLGEQAWDGNLFLISRLQKSKDVDGAPVLFTPHLFDDGLLSLHAVAFPIWIKTKHYSSDPLFTHLATEITRANLSAMARTYLDTLEFNNPDTNAEVAGLIWYHALAIGYSPDYQTGNIDGIGQDFPRIPLPAERSTLEQSAQLGQQIAALLLPDQDGTGVTVQLLPYQKMIAVTKFLSTERDLGIRGNWGYRTPDGKVMPGGGKVEQRNYSADELQAFTDSGFDEITIHALFGTSTYDVYLNDTTFLSNIPLRIWQYVIGGYQVMKKWLSYREESVLGRALTKEEVRELASIARRLTGLLALEPSLNRIYQLTISDVYHPQVSEDSTFS